MKKCVVLALFFLMSQKICAINGGGELPYLYSTEMTVEKFSTSKKRVLVRMPQDFFSQKKVYAPLLVKNHRSDFFSKPFQLSVRLSKNFRLVVSYN